MDKDKILDNIFSDDPFNLLEVKPKPPKNKTGDERLIESFKEINAFIRKNGKEPQANISNVSEYQLNSRLRGICEDEAKIEILKDYDEHNLLPSLSSLDVKENINEYKKEIDSIDDIFSDDSMNILDDEVDIFTFKHTPIDYERAKTDFVAKRKPCKNFDDYEDKFKQIQKELSTGERKLYDFNERQLIVGNYFVHNGILLFLERIDNAGKDKFNKEDGRTKIIFENGTQSNMKLRSLGKNLFMNGKCVSENSSKLNKDFIKNFSTVTDEDKQAGYIYILKSKSNDERISSIDNLYKIGYSTTDVKERVKNAVQEPTYLMAPVQIESVWECYNLNSQKLEQLIHNFLGSVCLNIDVYDSKGKRHMPKEWFVAPLHVIEEAIQLIISGDIVKYRYNKDIEEIVVR